LASRGFRAGERFLPPDPRVDEPYLFTPKMALRVAILGAIALAVFAVLFLRLWSLQVLSSTKYVAAASNNQVRRERVQPQRGLILDRKGRVLVRNVVSSAVVVTPADLPKKGRYRMLKQLATILNADLPAVLKELETRKNDPLTPVTVQVAVREEAVKYLAERKREFPGMDIRNTFLRRYNSQALAAHVLGYVREVSPQQLKQMKKQRAPGDIVGQAGVELTYDPALFGTPGVQEVTVDSHGDTHGAKPRLVEPPKPGKSISLTIDIALQRAAERALKYGITLARSNESWAANGGAIVALDPRTGEILALASAPTFKPGLFVGRLDRKKVAPLLDAKAAKEGNYPGLNRATAGLYPAGSTFKPVTALAAMQEGVVSAYQTVPCTPTYEVHGQVFKNWDPYMSAPMTMTTALAMSCDTYFYELGYRFYGLPPDRGHPLQAWAGRFGFGGLTGIDVGPEQQGLLPTPEWREATYTKKSDPCCWEIDRLWKPGDSIQLAIGQKDLLVTPLQMARFYALVANGGKLVTPHVVKEIDGQPFVARPPDDTHVDAAALAAVRDGLYQATHASYGTSAAVFAGFPIPIAGKTGTAEKVVHLPGYDGLMDQAWWCGYGPANQPPPRVPELVVCALIENGGHGGSAAAPAAAQVFAKYFNVPPPEIGVVHSD
jgi:penicillin-binding protein 2